MASSGQSDDDKPKEPWVFVRPVEARVHGQELIYFTKLSRPSMNQCYTCVGPITLTCAPLLHVARCQAIVGPGVPCNRNYNTPWGCHRHRYQDGHNLEMRDYTDSIGARPKHRPLVNPAVEAIQKMRAEYKNPHKPEDYRRLPFVPYTGPVGLPLEGSADAVAVDPKNVAAWKAKYYG